MADGILNPIEQLEADFDFEVYTKQEVDALLDEKADKSDTYTKTETDALLDDKADADAVYTKTETDTLLSAKADKSTTLAGYGITDAYTKTQTDTLLNGKADADSVYTKTEINTKIPNTVGSATKPTYVNGGVLTECTYELNKTVPANAVFTDTTYSAGNGLNLSGTSFSAKAGTNVTVDGNGINVNGSGVVTSADSGLINGGTAYTELRPTLDGTWVKNAQTTATNLQKLEGGIEYLYGLLSHQYDQLKKYINGNYYDYDTDTNSAYTKSVPAGAMPYASLEQIGGKTVVWNQLVQNGNFADASGWSIEYGSASVSNNVLTYTVVTPQSNAFVEGNVLGTVTGHKYLVTCEIRYNNTLPNQQIAIGSGGYDMFLESVTQLNTWVGVAGFFTRTSGGADKIRIYVRTGTATAGDTIDIKNVMCVDLTLMFEAGNEPTTVQEFQQTFPAVWYAHNPGTLLSAGVTEVKSVGVNVWDEQWENGAYSSTTGQKIGGALRLRNKNPIPVLPSQTYYFYSKSDLAYTSWFAIYEYDSDGNFIRIFNVSSANRTFTVDANCCYICFNTSDLWSGATYIDGSFCINLSNASINGNYYHYQEHTYPIPAEIRNLEGYGWSAGSVFNYVDFERKVFVKCVDRVDMGTMVWSNAGQWFYSHSLASTIKPCASTVTVGNLLTSPYPTVSYSTLTGGADKAISYGRSTHPMDYVMVRDSAYATDVAFTSAMSGVYLYYELATPIETDISAYLTDDNLIEVEPNGTLTFPNSNGTDYQIPVPSAETYMVDLQEAI